jgi:dimethylhistidine N-methyltransferase
MNDISAIQFYDYHPGTASLREEVLHGLALQPKVIPPKFFYDERGSKLFDAICKLPEYYPTRTEIAILQTYAEEIAALAGPESLLIELGSGASKKVRLLLDALRPSTYMAVDISKDFLLQSARQLAADYPWLEVHAACADFSQTLNLSYCPLAFKKLAFFPGSSIGNFDPLEAVAFLEQLAKSLYPEGALLIGVDLKKDPRLLHAAYNDSQGVTAAFNLNLLHRIQSELDTDLNPREFQHHAFFNEALGRVEMHLISRRTQRLRIENQFFDFAEGESIHTENSYKYSVTEFHKVASYAGYQAERVWIDDRQLFSVHFLTVKTMD